MNLSRLPARHHARHASKARRAGKAAPTDINFVGVVEFWSVGKLDL